MRGVKIYASPESAPVENGVVLASDGVIAAVGAGVAVPAGAEIIECAGCVVTAGFWNTHVHFTGGQWSSAAWKPASDLDSELAAMLTSHGFTTVVDASSDPRITLSLRRRIEAGELHGPRIFTAGNAIYPPDGVPYYTGLPFFIKMILPQPASPEAAVRDVERGIATGADLVKLFTGSYVRRGVVKPMPLAIAQAAVLAAHRHGQMVYSHPSNLAGTMVAIQAGVDVLAHAPDSTEGVDEVVLRAAVTRGMAMIPTLQMFAATVSTDAAYLDPIYTEVSRFRALGGELLFGTDVGYMTDYSTGGEFAALAKAGLDWRAILRMLTVAPARRFHAGPGAGTGEIAPGAEADLTVLDGDPAADVGAFSRVRLAIRRGRVIFRR